MTRALWSPVVLARLLHVDAWWRAVPEGTTADGWLGDVVSAAVMNGRSLERGPRMVLARPAPAAGTGTPPVLVGVACDAELLSPYHHTDSGGRPLYCFVGWLGSSGADGIPSLDALTEGFVRWAGPVYEGAVAPDWAATTTPEWRGHSVPERPPWGPDDCTMDRGAATAVPRAESPGLWLLPRSGAGSYWDGARLSGEPCALVTGWGEETAPSPTALTHLCSAVLDTPVFKPESDVRTADPGPTAEPVREQTTQAGVSTEENPEPEEDGITAAVLRRWNQLRGRVARAPKPWPSEHGGAAAPASTTQPSATDAVPARLPLPPGPMAGWTALSHEALADRDLLADLDDAPTRPAPAGDRPDAPPDPEENA